jgi:hypothetical protein
MLQLRLVEIPEIPPSTVPPLHYRGDKPVGSFLNNDLIENGGPVCVSSNKERYSRNYQRSTIPVIPRYEGTHGAAERQACYCKVFLTAIFPIVIDPEIPPASG